MTKLNLQTRQADLGRLVSECFCGGEIGVRELRLTREQARRLAADYPASQVRPLGDSWYEIRFQGAFQNGN